MKHPTDDSSILPFWQKYLIFLSKGRVTFIFIFTHVFFIGNNE